MLHDDHGVIEEEVPTTYTDYTAALAVQESLITPPQKPDCLSISTLIAIGNLLKNPEFPLNQSLKPDYLLLERKIGIVQNESVGRTA